MSNSTKNMYKYLIMLIFCLAARRTSGKSLFEYNVNPEHDLLAEESRSYSNFWPSSELYGPSQGRIKHYAGPHGRGNNKGFGPPHHSYGHSGPHNFPQSFEEYDDASFDFPQHHHHPHGFPPGQAKKHGYGHPHEPPRRFPPPPVYDNDFINPWGVQQPPLPTPTEHIAPTVTTSSTTPAPISSTTSDDQLTYDIDVRFGRD